MRTITFRNPKILDEPYTVISQDYSSGTTLYVEDSSNFIDNDLILVGGQGNEKAELTDLTATPSNKTSLTITALNFDHDVDESVQKVLWDKYELQFKTTSDADWQALVAAGDFDWGKDNTTYVHQDGAATYYYRSRYYNSATGKYSGWSDTTPGSGLTRNQVGWMVKRVRKKAKKEDDPSVTDKEIIASFNTVHDIVRGLNRRWKFLKTEYEFLTEASTRTYDLPDNFDRGYRLKYRYDDGATDIEYYLKYLPKTEFDDMYKDQDADPDDDIIHYTIDEINNKIELGPKPETAGYTCTLVYFKTITDVNSYGDELIIPLPDLYKHYAVADILEDDEDPEKATYHKNEFGNMIKVLEQMRVKTPYPRSFKRYRGRHRMYGNRNTYSDAQRENNW